MLLQLFVLFPNGEDRLLYEAGAISTIQREARLFNREHPDNTRLVFNAYQLVAGRRELVLIGKPRNEKSLNWEAPEAQETPPARTQVRVAVLGKKRIVRDRVYG